MELGIEEGNDYMYICVCVCVCISVLVNCQFIKKKKRENFSPSSSVVARPLSLCHGRLQKHQLELVVVVRRSTLPIVFCLGSVSFFRSLIDPTANQQASCGSLPHSLRRRRSSTSHRCRTVAVVCLLESCIWVWFFCDFGKCLWIFLVILEYYFVCDPNWFSLYFSIRIKFWSSFTTEVCYPAKSKVDFVSFGKYLRLYKFSRIYGLIVDAGKLGS